MACKAGQVQACSTTGRKNDGMGTKEARRSLLRAEGTGGREGRLPVSGSRGGRYAGGTIGGGETPGAGGRTRAGEAEAGGDRQARSRECRLLRPSGNHLPAGNGGGRLLPA